jgi:hypothetical protein
MKITLEPMTLDDVVLIHEALVNLKGAMIWNCRSVNATQQQKLDALKKKSHIEHLIGRLTTDADA